MTIQHPVALRKESVDRNGIEVDGVSYDVWSLSARRAWIEITRWNPNRLIRLVALRKESVDRNARRLALSWAVFASLSARRAWIEIAIPVPLL